MKRLARECFRRHRPFLKPYDYVLLFYPQILEKPRVEIRKLLEEALASLTRE